ncbi:hypothetical protein BK731_29265 [Bacillus thuringiensis serovar muju]|nr:CDP-glycerol glycerophosphotransferase family protein [Bacillus thuringiensis]MBH0350445.1 hypothetical protein [Bacillus thuringiensis]OTX99194.1 hypothetical protein BK731_29265 [Bacillus thuringiensis serovar muju]
MIDSHEKLILKMRIKSFLKKRGKWQFVINVKHTEKCEVHSVTLNKRNGEKYYSIPHKSNTLNAFATDVYFEVDLNQLELEPFFWDFYINIKCEKIKSYRIKHPNFIVNKKINNRLQRDYTKKGYVVYPYITIKNGLSLHFRKKGEYDRIKYAFKEIMALILFYIFKSYWKRKKIILIYEKFSKTAQDNSYYLFKYCYSNEKIPNLYYVINKASNDYDSLIQYEDRVIEFMSIKHLIYLLACQFMISSESKAHCYIWKENRGKFKQVIHSKKHVFLQHGVLGLKRVDSIFKKDSPNGTNLFFVSSNYEKNIVKQHFNYSDDEIIVSGLARWDYLRNKTQGNKHILVVPTWRESLDEVTKEQFLNSNFYKQYKSMLNNKRLIGILEEHGITLKFCMHPRLYSFNSYFTCSSSKVQFVTQQYEKINELIMQSVLLVTDYSSISWDMYYLEKPIVFFQFDFMTNGYFTDEKELFGDKCVSMDELIQHLTFYINNGFKEKKKYKKMRKYFFSYVDTNNSKRIVDGILSKIDYLKK